MGDDGGGGDSGGCDTGGGYDSGGCDNNYSFSAQVDNDFSGIGSTASALESAIGAVHQIESTVDVFNSSDTTADYGQSQVSNDPSKNDYEQGGDTYNPLLYTSRNVSNSYAPWRWAREHGRDGESSDCHFKIAIGIAMAVILLFTVMLIMKKSE